MNHLFGRLLFCWINFSVLLFGFQSLNAQDQAYTFRSEVSGEGPTVILIPGLTTDGAVWDQTVTELSGQFTCHVLTLPGFAKQPKMSLENGFLPVLKEEVVKYIKDQELGKVTIIGHSLGGFMALDIAANYQDLVEKLVIVDALPFMGLLMNPMATEENMKPMAKSMNQAMANQTKEQYGAQLKQIMASMITDTANQAIAYEWGMQSDGATAGQAMYELYTTDLRDELKEIKVPTLVLGAWIAYKNFGATRESTLANYQMQYQNLEGVQIKMTDIGRHFIMWDDPTFFFKEVEKFLGK